MTFLATRSDMDQPDDPFDELDESLPAADEFQEQESPTLEPEQEAPYTPPPAEPDYAPQEPAFNPQAAIEDAAKRLRQEWVAEQALERMENSVAHAREIYNGKNGLPSFDD